MLIFKMHTKEGKKHEFMYDGYTMHKPNRVSMSGYGSDEWFYICEKNGIKYMLIFSDAAEYGTLWECFNLEYGEDEKLKNGNLDLWLEIYFKKKERNRIVGLHLENINEVRIILPKCSRCYSFNDTHYYGMY